MNRFLALLLFGTISYGAAAEETGSLRAAAAAAVVNPPPGSFIAGDAQNRKFQGVHDDLFAKAVVLHDGRSAVAFVTVDCIGLISPTIQRIQSAAAERAALPGLTADRVIVASTHSHNGPDVVGLWGESLQSSGVDKAYLAALVDAAAEQVRRAAVALAPARLVAASVESQVAWVENVCEPGDLDRTLAVLKLESPNGQCIATVTNFACHPTILDGVHDLVSADWPGGLYRGMSEQLAGEHLFFQGAVGGWVQPVKGDRSFDLADRYGRELAAEALAALQQAKPVADPTIQFASTTISIPVANEGWKQLSQIGVLPIRVADTIETTLAAVRIGDVALATHPGETAPEHSRQTRRMLAAETTMVIGLGLDALGYILKPDYFAHPDKYPQAEYLMMTSLGPQAAPQMMAGLRDVTQRIQPSPRQTAGESR